VQLKKVFLRKTRGLLLREISAENAAKDVRRKGCK
jgi:hypothetical protein